jgi:secreted PhoX family phosphatase
VRNNLAFYMGDDERNEYIYKFVCAGKYNPATGAPTATCSTRHAVTWRASRRRHRV